MTIRAGAAGGGFEHIGEIPTRDGVDNQDDQGERDDPHKKHALLLSFDSRIAGVIKECVKARQRVFEDFYAGNCLIMK
jgi:hypothetical protein